MNKGELLDHIHSAFEPLRYTLATLEGIDPNVAAKAATELEDSLEQAKAAIFGVPEE